MSFLPFPTSIATPPRQQTLPAGIVSGRLPDGWLRPKWVDRRGGGVTSGPFLTIFFFCPFFCIECPLYEEEFAFFRILLIKALKDTFKFSSFYLYLINFRFIFAFSAPPPFFLSVSVRSRCFLVKNVFSSICICTVFIEEKCPPRHMQIAHLPSFPPPSLPVPRYAFPWQFPL